MNTYRSLRDILLSNADKFCGHQGLRCQPLVLLLNADLLCMYMLIKISSLASCYSVAMSYYNIIIKLTFAEHGFHNLYWCILQYTTFKTHFGDMSKMHIVNNQCRQECVVFRKGTMDTGQQLDSITEQVQLATRVIHVGRECSVCQLVQLLFS